MNRRDGDEWKKARHRMITGTDVGKILGCDARCSRTKLLKCKIARIDPAEDASDYAKRLMELGKAFESAALGAFRDIRGAGGLSYEGVVPGMTAHSQIPWLVGTPDYILDDGGTVVEVKTHFYPSAVEAVPFEDVQRIPSKHWLQVQAYMEILDVDTGILWSWTMENGGRCYEIRRAKLFWIQTVMPELSAFWAKMAENDQTTTTTPRYVWPRGAREAMIQKVEAEKMNTTTTVILF
jgi:predicted phage-related endonuclease